MIYKIFLLVILGFPLLGQITEKQLDDVPSVEKIVQLEPTVITIGKKSFNVTELGKLYKKSTQTDSLPEKSLKQFVDNFIIQQLKIAKAEKDGIDTTAAFREEIATLKKELSAAYMVEKSVNDALIKEAYERLQTEVSVVHILISVDQNASPDDTLMAYQKISEIREQILAGQKFNEMALKYSADPTVNKDEGNLGYLTAFQTVYPFESACYKTPVGKISLPFRTPFGYHIVKVLAKREYQRWKAGHIFVAINDKSVEVDQLTAKKKIDAIYAKLQAGENFEKLARLNSEDISTNTKGGVFKRMFGTDELEKPFEDALFTIKKNGFYSAPIRTSKGWHIVRLIEKQELKPFDEMYNFLQNKVAADARFELAKKSMLIRIKKENNFREFQSVINESNSLIDSLLTLKRPINQINIEFLKKPIFSIGDSEIPVKKYIDFVANKHAQSGKPYFKGLNDIWYNQFEMAENMAYEEDILPKKNTEFAQILNDYREGILINSIDEGNLMATLFSDTLSQKAYYLKNIEKYNLPERIAVEVLDANSMLNLQKAKETFSKNPYSISLKWNDLLFTKNNSELTVNHKQHLSDLALLLLKNQNYIIEVAGNIDPDETEQVSSERAQKVVKFITALGVPLQNIIEKDEGKFQPVSKTEREKNSRVSFKLFSSNKQDVAKIFNVLKPESLKIVKGYFKKGENKTVDMLQWVVGEQQIEKGGRFILAKVDQVEPARKMTYLEAKGKVIKAMQLEKEAQLIAKLKAMFPVTVNEDQLKKVTK
jgi:peptidyl-prolyl cis-trans isomerase SurA